MNAFCFLATKLDYDSDEDDDIFGGRKKAAQPTKPAPAKAPAPAYRAPSIPSAFQVIGGDRYFRMKLPLLQFPYKGDDNTDRYTSIVQMPSGCAERGIVDFKIKNGTVKLIVNVSLLMIFHPTDYCALFLDSNGDPIYKDMDHVKIHGHFDAVKKMKGSAATNRIFFVFEFKPDIVIDGDKVFEEKYVDAGIEYVIPGFQLIKATTGKSPQIFAHFEFKQKVDGHAFAQAESDEDHLQGEEDESSSSSDSSAAPTPAPAPAAARARAPAPAPAPSSGSAPAPSGCSWFG